MNNCLHFLIPADDGNGVNYVIKVNLKPNSTSENSLDHENEILTKLKKLAGGNPMNVGIIDNYDFIKYGKIVLPKKNVTREKSSFTCNAMVITYLEIDLFEHIRPNSCKVSAKQIFMHIYNLVKK